MSNRLALLVTALLWLSATMGVAQVPKGSYGPVALVGATAYTVTQDTIENCTVVLRDGKIEAIGANVSVPGDARVIDCKGRRVYPGFIDGGTRLGLSEIGSDPRTHDYNEVGNIVPQMRALTAVNPNSALIPVTRVNGVTTVLSAPTGGLFSGTAALINLYGYTPEQMYAGFEGVVLNFPSTSRGGSNDKRKSEEIAKAATKAMKKLDDVWQKAVEYDKLDSALGESKPDYYPELIALQPVLRGTMPLIVEVDDAGDILRALEWVREKEIRKVIFAGVREGWRVADKIAEAGIPVITGKVLTLPGRAYDRYDRSYANPAIMNKAGVTVALRTNEANNVRNLPYNAGVAAAYGLGKEEALRAITIVPAQIFGVADKLGSLEAGKDATLFVCDGDPLEPATNILHLFIKGWDVPLVSRQTLLYDEFLHREPGLQKP
ncbi:MAG: amidohydrolase family protein [Cyclobacteriaceae bacterium]|jgi:imidazolonepropionase-like amidohydrolase|nr:amidohydrolase family protein [Cyclobacteriaceae bacterium]